jgi:hypothetical protein
MDLTPMPWHHRQMARRWVVYVLVVLTVLEVGSVMLIPLLGENARDTNPPLQALVLPFMETWPFGPPLLLMLLLGFLGHSRRVAKVAARAVAGLLFYIPFALIMMGYASSDSFVLGVTDLEICAVALILGALLAWFGFKSDAAAATEGAA